MKTNQENRSVSEKVNKQLITYIFKQSNNWYYYSISDRKM